VLVKINSRLLGHVNAAPQIFVHVDRFRSRLFKFSVREPIRIGREGRIVCRVRLQTKANCFINLGSGELLLGDKVYHSKGVSINCHLSDQIGEKVLIGEDIRISHHDHIFSTATGYSRKNLVLVPIAIGDNTCVGSGGRILNGVKIGSKVLIAAGSVVTRTVPDGTVFVQRRQASGEERR
jgi:acetyltransferase-like isoleucine patch superfamily enzyme